MINIDFLNLSDIDFSGQTYTINLEKQNCETVNNHFKQIYSNTPIVKNENQE